MTRIGLIFPCTNPAWQGAEIDRWDYKGVPIGLLSVASYLDAIGHSVRIIDTMMYSKKEVDQKIDNLTGWADVIGFSVMTTQVRHALTLSDRIKRAAPQTPVVWGGIHPTLFPEQSEADSSVDYVVYGEGERAIADLTAFLATGKPDLGEIPNLVYKNGNEVKKNPAGGLCDVNRLPKLAYHLLDIDKYIDRSLLGRPVRGLDILTSRGCPYRCSFCANTILLGRKWRPRDLDAVFAEIDELVSAYRLDNLWIMDDYFFGNRHRSHLIAQHIIDKGYKLAWEANIRANDLATERMDGDFLKVMEQSGLAGLKIGAESGSDEILKLLEKDITVKQIVAAVDRCRNYQIIPYLYFMHGIPGESIDNIKKTSYFMFQLKKRYPEVVLNGPGVFRPYPGSKLYQRCVEAGFRTPASLRGWAQRDLGANYLSTYTLPWIPNPGLVDDLHWYLYKACREDRILRYRYLWPRKILGWMAGWRFRHDFWKLRFEPRLVAAARRFRDRFQEV
ncbi:MAG: B12-binding domain-containing radical SAM protein [Actinobacteria bacterium]|nr:B12-binding domain-containing radical SAM protein [Actinomycetota bacterium]